MSHIYAPLNYRTLQSTQDLVELDRIMVEAGMDPTLSPAQSRDWLRGRLASANLVPDTKQARV